MRDIGLNECGFGKGKTYAQAIETVGKSQTILSFLKEAGVLKHGGDLTLLVNPDPAFLAENRSALTKVLATSFGIK